MGYYSHFALRAKKEVYDDFIKFSEDAEGCLPEEFGEFGQSCKWYSAEDDLEEFSKKYPDELLEMTIEGEERDHNEIVFCKAGICYKDSAKIIWPTFDEKLLKRQEEKLKQAEQ